LPRTSRTISPRLTVSMTAVDRSSVGAAGFILARPYVIPAIATNPTKIRIPVRMRFLDLDFGERLISICLNQVGAVVYNFPYIAISKDVPDQFRRTEQSDLPTKSK
jgi:hypothetical protein